METVKLIGSVVSTVLLPLIGVFMFYNSKKRKEEAQATMAETDNINQYAAEWKELYEKKEAKVIEMGDTINRLYREKNEDRLRIREGMEEITRLKLENQRLNFLKCDIALKCFDRVPPNDFMKEENDDKNQEIKKDE